MPCAWSLAYADERKVGKIFLLGEGVQGKECSTFQYPKFIESEGLLPLTLGKEMPTQDQL
jgi:hypothetical protein